MPFNTEKCKLTAEGGFAVLLKNDTGGNSVKGTIVSPSTTDDDAFEIQSSAYDAFGVVYESGVADGSYCWVIIGGRAQVLLADSTAAVRGNWTKCSDTDGRAEVTTAPTGIGALSTAEHFKEIGHCIESKDAGTNVLAYVILHFN